MALDLSADRQRTRVGGLRHGAVAAATFLVIGAIAAWMFLVGPRRLFGTSRPNVRCQRYGRPIVDDALTAECDPMRSSSKALHHRAQRLTNRPVGLHTRLIRLR